jgi:hypothetical protein
MIEDFLGRLTWPLAFATAVLFLVFGVTAWVNTWKGNEADGREHEAEMTALEACDNGDRSVETLERCVARILEAMP